MRSDRVVTIGASSWPGYSRLDDAVLVDLRLFPKGAKGTADELAYLPDELRASGIPENIIAAAGGSEPAGFVLMTKGAADGTAARDWFIDGKKQEV